MRIINKDKDILRRLAARQREIAELDIHQETVKVWKNINSLESNRSPLLIYQIPWHEMEYHDELKTRCEDDFCRKVETTLRRNLYQWQHMPVDMVVEPVFRLNATINDSGFGISENSEVIVSDVSSRHFRPQITSEKDLEKIKFPQVSLDTKTTGQQKHQLEDIFGDLLGVEVCGVGKQWFAPWDLLITWYGVEEAMMDMILKPELVHAIMDRLMNAYIHRLEQYEQLNILVLNNGNTTTGSGGLGYTDELPQPDYNENRVRTLDQWGCATAQIFSEVSPEMHQEFALNYEKRWLERFGLTYYGCCEPLHHKIDILRSIPNLRKISISPWANIEKAVEAVGKNYVLSLKPNPASFAADEWSIENAKKELTTILDKTAGCHVEIILKDLSTVRNHPQRLWQWAAMAKRVVQEYSPHSE